MHRDVLFLVITFLFVIVAIVTIKDIDHSMILITLITNFLIISYYVTSTCKRMYDICDEKNNSDKESFDEPAEYVPGQNDDEEEEDQTGLNQSIYGAQFDQYLAYGTTPTLREPDNFDNNDTYARAMMEGGVDAMLMSQTAKRNVRSKTSLTSACVKDADFYRFHYGDEFDVEEKKPWWGNNE